MSIIFQHRVDRNRARFSLFIILLSLFIYQESTDVHHEDEEQQQHDHRHKSVIEQRVINDIDDGSNSG
jgi:hypothetical protein